MRRGCALLLGLVGGCSSGSPPIGPGPVTFESADATGTSSPASNGTDSEGGTSDDTDDSDTPTTSASSSGGPLEPPDYALGTWMFENISGTPTMGLHGRRALLDTGQDVVAWAEVDPDDLGILNILAATQSGNDWTFEPLTAFQEQNTYPTMVGVGDTAFLAWTGRTHDMDDYDIWLTSWNGTAWATPRNLTDNLEDPLAPTDDSRPVMVRRPGSLVVAFTVSEPGTSSSGVWVTEFLPDALPATREVLVPSGAGSCLSLTGASSNDGVAHYVALCSGSLIHATDRSGEWDHDTLGGVGTGVLSPSASQGVDGNVHLLWVQQSPCGAEQCEEIFYAKTSDGVFGNPVPVTNTANLSERMPAVATDPWGRVLVLSQIRLDNIVHLRLSISEDGGATFSEPMRITPEATLDDYQNATDIAFDADGLPSFVYEQVIDASDPLNIDIHRATFVPG